LLSISQSDFLASSGRNAVAGHRRHNLIANAESRRTRAENGDPILT
jgi:hypothetical protein